MSNYPDNFQGTNMDISDDSTGEFEPITLSECDQCQELLLLNKFGYCKACNEESEAFNKAALAARKRGHDPFKAGMIAQTEIVKKQQNLRVCLTNPATQGGFYDLPVTKG